MFFGGILVLGRGIVSGEVKEAGSGGRPANRQGPG